MVKAKKRETRRDHQQANGPVPGDINNYINWQLHLNSALAELYEPLISPSASIEDITHVILEKAKSLTGSEHGYVAYIDPITKDLVAYTLTEMFGNQCKVKKKHPKIVYPVRKDGRYNGLWGHSLNTRQGFYTNAPKTHPAAKGPPGGHVPIERLLSFPVLLGEELVGQIAVANPGKDYTDRDLEAIHQLGKYYALAIQHRRAEDSLRISQEKLKNILESSPDSIAVTDINGKIVDCNPATLKLYGFTSKEEMIGRDVLEFITPDGHQAVFENTQKTLEQGSVRDVEYSLIRSDGTTFPGELNASVMRDSKGNPIYFVGITKDISERKKTEEELKKHREHLEDLVKERTGELAAAHERLRQAQKMEAIGTLAGGIAHDFNNVLGAIIGYTELAMLDVGDNAIMQDNLNQVLTAAQRAKDMVKQILTFSRKSKEERKPVLLSNVIEEAVKFLKSTLPANIDITVNIDNNVDPLTANPTQLHQVVMNICTNAAHAMREKGGELTIELKEIYHYHGRSAANGLAPGRYQKLSISDTGVGMSANTLERIFEPYFTSKRVGEGTGMGLAVVHGIVKDHNGDISVDSTLGRGTTFQIFFPVLSPDKAQHQDVGDEQKTGPAGSKGNARQKTQLRILFVDDEQMLVEIGRQVLNRLGHQVTALSDSQEAWQCFQKTPDNFDLLMIDMNMPKLMGIDMIRQCKTIRPAVPVILCTGFDQQINEDNFKSYGVDAFVMKPLEMDRIAGIIEGVMEGNFSGGQKAKAPFGQDK